MTDTLDTRFPRTPNLHGKFPRGRLGSLLPTGVNPDMPTALSGLYTFGASADSTYEYYIKQHQLLQGSVSQYSRMYSEAIDSALEYELLRPINVVPGRDDMMVMGHIVR